VYLVREKKFVLYADKCLDRHALRLVADQFNLINPTIARDEHYQCASCNPDFLD
jgi:23S rRNA A1618 N6-methylase RlmF